MRLLSPLDQVFGAADHFLRSIATTPPSRRAYPAKGMDEPSLSEEERKLSAALMRVNHSGEVAAQALYQGQAMTAKSPETVRLLKEAAAERLIT